MTADECSTRICADLGVCTTTIDGVHTCKVQARASKSRDAVIFAGMMLGILAGVSVLGFVVYLVVQRRQRRSGTVPSATRYHSTRGAPASRRSRTPARGKRRSLPETDDDLDLDLDLDLE
jgi:hypothetical protein